ncbi:MAG: hypothetical protein R3F37_04000 [Candidatus Competibacteraceae bacterium]
MNNYGKGFHALGAHCGNRYRRYSETIGVPSFLETIRNNRLITRQRGRQRSELRSHRSGEARVRVTVCRSVDGTVCNTEGLPTIRHGAGVVTFCRDGNDQRAMDTGVTLLLR